MVCKNCGQTVKTTDAFCFNCGMSFEENPVIGDKVVKVTTYEVVKTPQCNDNGIYGLMNRCFGSAGFLTMCIFASLAVVFQLFMLDYSNDNRQFLVFSVFPIIMTIFLWILYSMGVNGRMATATSVFKTLHIVAKIQYIISWVTVGCILALGVLLLLIEADTGSGKLEVMIKIAELAEKLTKLLIICLLLGPFYNIMIIFDLGFVLSLLFDDNLVVSEVISSALTTSDIGKSIFLVMLVFALAIAVFNKFFMGKAIESASAFVYSTEYGKDYYGSGVQTATWGYIIAGLFIAVNVVVGIGTNSMCVCLAYAGFFISSGLFLTNFSRQSWYMEQKRKAHPNATHKCAECGYSKPYVGQCPSCGSSEKVVF